MHDNLKINVREYRRENQNGQSRETGNKGHTIRIKTHWKNTTYFKKYLHIPGNLFEEQSKRIYNLVSQCSESYIIFPKHLSSFDHVLVLYTSFMVFSLFYLFTYLITIKYWKQIKYKINLYFLVKWCRCFRLKSRCNLLSRTCCRFWSHL